MYGWSWESAGANTTMFVMLDLDVNVSCVDLLERYDADYWYACCCCRWSTRPIAAGNEVLRA